jgi:outer membrane protein assembly factor BamD
MFMAINIDAKKLLAIAAAAAFAVPFLSCTGDSSKKLIKQGLYKCQERLGTAAQLMERRNFTGALRILEEVKYQCGGSPFMDTVYYYAAMSNFRLKQYEDARFEFETLYREHPRSPFAEEAHFRLAHMRFIQSHPPRRDQSETKEAMRLFNDYLDLFPKGAFADSAKALFMTGLNRLAEKEFNTARFYLRQREHEAALIYYRSVLREYPDSKFAPEAVVGMAEMLVLLGRTEDAEDVIEELDAAAFEEGLRARLEAVRLRLSGG